MIGKHRSAEVFREYGSNCPYDLMSAEGLSLARLDFGGARFREFSINGTIFLPLLIETSAEERSSLAHALGHHFLHVGNQVWMRNLDSIWHWKQERQAEEFAAWLLIPESEVPNLVGLTPPEVAQTYDVDLRLAELRVAGGG